MTEPNPPQTDDAREADDMGEKPDLGRTPDALTEAVSGSGMGSDTRAGSLQGGAASGSDIDPDQDVINESLASEGMRAADRGETPAAPPKAANQGDPVNNTGADTQPEKADVTEGKPGAHDDADAATG